MKVGWWTRVLARFNGWRYRYPRGRPRVGQWIYVHSARYLSHGRDDFAGGRARVKQVRDEGWGYMVEVEEQPGTFYNWTPLALEQRRLRENHGDELAHADPDSRPEFNRDSWS